MRPQLDWGDDWLEEYEFASKEQPKRRDMGDKIVACAKFVISPITWLIPIMFWIGIGFTVWKYILV